MNRSRCFVFVSLLVVIAFVPRNLTAEPPKEGHDNTFLLYRATLAAAEKALRLDEAPEAMRWLAESPAEHRGWEWLHLNAQLNEAVSAVQIEGDFVTSLAVSPRGDLVAAANADGSVRLLSWPGLKQIREVRHDDAVYCVAFSRDGKRLATVSRDVTSRVWDLETGREIARIKLDNPGVAAVGFSPDGSRVATCSWLMQAEPREVHGAVWIWEAETGKLLHKSRVGRKPLDSLAWTPNGQNIVVGSWDGLVHVLDDQGGEVRRLTVPDEGAYTAVVTVAVSPDGKLIAAGGKDRLGHVWNLETGELTASLRGHSAYVNEVTFSPSGKQLITAGEDGVLRRWDLDTPHSPAVLRGHQRSVDAVAWSSDGLSLISASRDGTLRTWDAQADFGGRTEVPACVSGTYTATFSPDGKQIITAMHDGRVLVFDASKRELVTQWQAHAESTCNTLAIDATGERLLTCSWDKTAKVWRIADQKLLHTLDAGDGVYDCDLSADGKLAALCVGHNIQLWDAESGKKLFDCEGHTAVVPEVAISPDGNYAASASADKTVRIWNTKNGKCEQVLPVDRAGVQAVAYSACGELLAAGDAAGQVLIWRTSDWSSPKRLAATDRGIWRLAFSPDGNRLAAGSDALILIDTDRCQLVAKFAPQNDAVYHLSFDPTGARLATCVTGGVICICESTPLTARRQPPLADAAARP